LAAALDTRAAVYPATRPSTVRACLRPTAYRHVHAGQPELEIYLHINKTKCIIVHEKVTAALAGGSAARARWSLRFWLCVSVAIAGRGWLSRQRGRARSLAGQPLARAGG